MSKKTTLLETITGEAYRECVPITGNCGEGGGGKRVTIIIKNYAGSSRAVEL